MKPDWFSRILLLTILAVVCYLALRPQPGRYRVQELPYVFDTATGRLVMLSADEEVKKHWRKLEIEERTKALEQHNHKELVLERDCPQVLIEGRREKRRGRDFTQIIDDAEHNLQFQECQDWQASKR